MATVGKSGNQSSWSVPVEPMPSNPKRILCVRLRRWPIDRWRRQCERRGEGEIQARRHEGTEARRKDISPLVLVRTVASRQVVAVASEEGMAGGVRAGLSLAEARALCPGLIHADHEPERDAKALLALA